MEPLSRDKLVPCFECGSRISPVAPACPKCKTRHIRGVRCKLCSKTLKASEATTWDKGTVHPVAAQNFNDSVYHRSCLQVIVPEMLPESLPCKECGASLRRSSVVRWSNYHGYERIPCPECGTPSPIEVSRCQRCGIPVFFAAHHCVLTRQRKYCFESYEFGKDCYHVPCYKRYFDEQLGNPYSSIFGYEAEYSKGKLIRELDGDDHTRHVLKLRCKQAKKQGKSEVFVMSLNGPFISFWRTTIQSYGIAKKRLGLGNLSGRELEMAKKIEGWGYSLFVSKYPFTLMIRL
jgi:hypothetical protein